MKYLFLIFTFLLINSCTSLQKNNLEKSDREYQLGAYLWQQTSGEYRALCYQAFNIAKEKLDLDLEQKHNKRRAVVFDIDETVFDNSFGGAYEIKNNIPWGKENFNKWVKLKVAKAIPGAKEFINYAYTKGVEIIYISNRYTSQMDETLENFNSLGIHAKKENFYFMTDEWSKEKRRREVLQKYYVVMYFGDNLHDFHGDFDLKNWDERRKMADQKSMEFGSKYIVLPNPLYGDWEKTLPKNKNRVDNLITIP